MHTPNDATQLPFQRLEIYVVAKAIAVLVHRAEIGDAELRDQARRASKSAFLNLSEGLPSDSVPMRRRYFSSAAGSVCETAAAVDLASALGLIDGTSAREVLALCVRMKQMLRALR
ncbi:MAG TPA: four helix bundle protein [Polyangiaceae bacterium]